MPAGAVRVEVAELDSAGNRQISPRRRASELLQERKEDIQAAVSEASSILQESAAEVAVRDWQVSSIEATFGVTLAAEAGVLLSRASAEASFEVTITIERA